MGDENTILSAGEIRHLLRRTGFGAPKKIVDDMAGLSRGEAAGDLLRFASRPKSFRPVGRDFFQSHDKWIRQMLRTRQPLQTKLVLFWHDHFATGFSKVQDADLMATQVNTLHRNCAGSMKDLVKAMNIDPAMMEFLDTVRNRKFVPNENYARELQELFTLGVNDLVGTGSPNYLQADIVQIARAFTGLRYDRGKPYLDEDRHDYNAEFQGDRGPKVIFQGTGGFGGAGRDFTVNGESTEDAFAAETDTVTDILFDHRDSGLPSHNTVARRTAHRLLEYFAHPSPDIAVVDQVVAGSGFDTTFDIAALVRAILVHDAFYDSGDPAPFGPSTKKSVKWPVDYVISTLRLLGVRTRGQEQRIEGGNYLTVQNHLENMGQILLDPPSVFGWNWEAAWVSSSTLLARYGFARDVTSARDRSSSSFRSDRIKYNGSYLVSLSDPAEIVDAVIDILGIPDQLTGAEKTVLVDYLTDNGANPTLDLGDYDTRQRKLHGLFALVLQSPAFQLH